MSFIPDDQPFVIQAVLDEAVRRLEGTGCTATSELKYGKPAEQIILAAAEIEADLIIVGHRDQGMLARWLNGSVGKSILHQPPCSVLVAVKSERYASNVTPTKRLAEPRSRIRASCFSACRRFRRTEVCVSNRVSSCHHVPASDRWRLEELARGAAEQGDADALSLMAEINRAKIVPDRAERLEPIITMGSWVTYWADWGVPARDEAIGVPRKVHI